MRLGLFSLLVLLATEILSSHARSPESSTSHSLLRRVPRELYIAKSIQQYELLKPKDIRDKLLRWAAHYPDLVRVETAQKAYGLGTAGGPDDCPFDDEQDGCLNYILTIQDFVAHPDGSESSNRLPEVLWSGEVHGNEQVGPTAVMEAAQLLIDAATCVAHPQKKDDPTEYQNEIEIARKCRQDFVDFGVDHTHLQWLARLVTTRRIVIVPTANALGYFRTQREEDGVDPNRDFPYDLEDPKKCMQTIAGRTLNEVFRSHMFQLSLTFHGGMEVVGYEWGAPSWLGASSPDDVAQNQIAAAYSRFGGGWKQSDPYQYGPMNNVVYPVRGGMEDWAYAGSWDPDRVIQCQPEQYGGYPAEKTTYDDSTLRVFNMLVETSDRKIPNKDQLGTSEQLMKGTSTGNGHVSRNIRLALLAADLVEPYVRMTSVNELNLSDDVVPLMDRSGISCQKTKAVTVPHNSRKVVLQWLAGGALTIDQTTLWYANWNHVSELTLDCMNQPKMEEIEALMVKGTPIGNVKGTTPFSKNGGTPPFSASIDISGFQPHDKIVVIASARVDQTWKTPPETVYPPFVVPQSHVVNARTNTSWFHEKDGKIIQGRLDWFSIPLTIEIGEYEDSGKHGTKTVETLELSNRFGDTSGGQGIPTGGITPSPPSSGGTTSPLHRFGIAVAVICSLVGITLVGRAYINARMRQSRRKQLRDYIEDPSAPSPDLRHNGEAGYSDTPNDYDGDGGLELGEYM